MPELLDLDPGSPGEWLAGVGIWVVNWDPRRARLVREAGGEPTPDRWTDRPGPWRRYTRWAFSGRLPSLSVIDEQLELLVEPPASPWLNHRGRGTPLYTRDALRQALRHVAEPVVLSGPGSHRTEAAAGWELDWSWRTPTAAEGGPDRGRPTVVAALALIGAWRAARWPGHWPRRSLAVGHVWEWPDAGEHRLDGWVVAWRREQMSGQPTAGHLVHHEVLRLTPPSWSAHVSRHVRMEPGAVMGVAEVAHRYGVERQEVTRAARRGSGQRSLAVGDRRIPAPVANVGAGGYVWDRAEVEAGPASLAEELAYGPA